MRRTAPERSEHRRPKRLLTRRWIPAAAVAAVLSGTVAGIALAGQSDAPEGVPRTAAKPGRAAAVHNVAMAGAGHGRAALARRTTALFSTVGVTWTSATKKLDGTAQIRTRSARTGGWSPWLDLDTDAPVPDSSEGSTASMHGGTQPMYVGDSNGVEARVLLADGTSASLPAGMRVVLVDPGTPGTTAATGRLRAKPAAYAVDATPSPSTGGASDTPSAAPSDTAAPSDPAATPSAAPSDTPSASASAPAAPSDPASASPSAPSAPASGSPSASASPSPSDAPTTPPPLLKSTVRKPVIISRAGWGADESILDPADPPTYGTAVKVVFVHHTVSSNNASCADSPAVIRGMELYHVQSNGWKDIGYNFLVDKCGRVFEGRSGGVDYPVIGSQTGGFNTDSAGIAVIGSYNTTVNASPAARDAVARVAAWKLGMVGGDPAGKAQLTARAGSNKYPEGTTVTFNQIAGHRDAWLTECPGQLLYASLPSIRSYAKTAGRNAAAPTGDYNADGANDLAVGVPLANPAGKVDAGSVTVMSGTTDGPTGPKLVLRQGGTGVPGNAETGDNFGAAVGYGDLNGDGRADLAIGAPGEDDTSGHTDTGDVTFLYGTATGFTGEPTILWTPGSTRAKGEKFGSAVTVGDFNADGRADVLAVAPGGWRYAKRDSATKTTTWGTLPGKPATSPGALTNAHAVSADFNRDGYADVALSYLTPAGKTPLVLFYGSSSGLKAPVTFGAPGGRSVAAGDFNGDGYPDLAAGQPYATEVGSTVAGGQITVYNGSSAGLTTTGRKSISQATSGVPGDAVSGDAMGLSAAAADSVGVKDRVETTQNGTTVLTDGSYQPDGYADLLVGLPGKDVTVGTAVRKDAGSAILLRGSASGLSGTGSVLIRQGSGGVPGSPEAGDRFGSGTNLADLSGYGRADLQIGADGENDHDGAVLQISSGGAGLGFTGAAFYGPGTVQTAGNSGIGDVLAP